MSSSVPTEKADSAQVLGSPAFPSPDKMTWVPLNVLQRPEDPKLNPQLPSAFVSLSYSTGVRARAAKVGRWPHASRMTSSQLCILEPWLFLFSPCGLYYITHTVSWTPLTPSFSNILTHRQFFFSPYLCCFSSILKRLLWIHLFLLRYRSPLS